MPNEIGVPEEKRSYTELLDPAMDLIASSQDGMLQADLWKVLQIDRSKCSRIVTKLERLGLIERWPVTTRGIRTFLIKQIKNPADVNELKGGIFARKHIDSYLTEIYLLYLVDSARVN
jgi:hypothetical protein